MTALPFSVVDAAAWTAEEAHQQLIRALPTGWSCVLDCDDAEAVVLLQDQSEAPLQVTRNADPKLAILDALGWLLLRQHRPTRVTWEPRTQEVELRRPASETNVGEIPDLDPQEIESVYNHTRSRK